ncbi:MAG: anthranilate phosphoribosyltransferase [Neisseriaceae bacterium]|nr:MAG: anthranilate phosphoribosyltransferase [Neisseriaceae bacterium]
MIAPPEALNRLLNNNEILYDEMTYLMREIMSGRMAPEMVAALLIGLRMKVETVSEITAAVNVLKEFYLAVPILDPDHTIDIVGTGGDGIKTFNISTTAMFVVAAAGAKIAKHGGKAVSSASGAADAIEAMGVNIYLSPEQIAESIEKTNIGFMYAPQHNQAMRHVAPVRRILGVRTIFNILGPLTNPANTKNQLLGVFHEDLLGICSNVGRQMGLKRMLVVYGSDGMDEITITGTTQIAELNNGKITRYEIHPEDFGISVSQDLSPIQAFSSVESLQKMDEVLAGEKGPSRDIVLLNAAAALYCVGLTDNIQEGVEIAQEAIDSKKAQQKKQEFIQFTNQIV